MACIYFPTVPYTSYMFDVLANTTDGKGEFSAPSSFRTLQAPPTSPLNFSVQTLSSSSLLLLWNPPMCTNGMISGYVVSKARLGLRYVGFINTVNI